MARGVTRANASDMSDQRIPGSWVFTGSGRFEGLPAGGQMKADVEKRAPSKGRETFTWTVAR